jgi:hypothetical protein
MNSKVMWSQLLATPTIFAAILMAASPSFAAETKVETTPDPAAASATVDATVDAAPVQLAQLSTEQPAAPASVPSVDALQQIQQYTNETRRQPQVSSVSQLSDVRPTDWAFQALSSLVERYGCIAGYPDGTFKGNRAMTRYEFAAGLNACLDRINELIAQATADFATKEDLAILQRLQEEFAAELSTLRGRVDSLEARTAELEANQFSTTTKLRGETIFAVSELFGGSGAADTNNPVFQYRTRLNFDTSFHGTDRLRARLQSANITSFSNTDSSGATVLGNEARLSFGVDTGSQVQVDDLYYRFPVGEVVTATVYANAGDFEDMVNPISPFVDGSQTTISRFGRYSPIYRPGTTSTGASLTFDFNDAIALHLGYGAGEGSNPAAGAGLFNGNYGAIAQLSFTPGDRLALGLTYANSYGGAGTGYNTGTGSLASRVNVANNATSVNAYGIQANFKISDGFQIGGWAHYAHVRTIGGNGGDSDVWSYAGTLGFPDLGGTGNLLGFVVGAEPYLARTDSTTGLTADPEVGLHVEGFYRLKVNDNISITPGVVWLTAPNHNENNDDAILGTIRTTFTF